MTEADPGVQQTVWLSHRTALPEATGVRRDKPLEGDHGGRDVRLGWAPGDDRGGWGVDVLCGIGLLDDESVVARRGHGWAVG